MKKLMILILLCGSTLFATTTSKYGNINITEVFSITNQWGNTYIGARISGLTIGSDNVGAIWLQVTDNSKANFTYATLLAAKTSGVKLTIYTTSSTTNILSDITGSVEDVPTKSIPFLGAIAQNQ